MNVPSEALLRMWAKTPSRQGEAEAPESEGGSWLSVVQHSRDAADVGRALAREWLSSSIRERLSKSLCPSSETASLECLLGWFAGCHDIGKIEILFQYQAARFSRSRFLWDQVATLPHATGLSLDSLYRCPHSLYSELILRRWLNRRFPNSSPLAGASIAAVAGCHHGVPSGLPWITRRSNSKAEYWLNKHGEQWAALWWELLDDIADRTASISALERLLESGGVPVAEQIFLAGFVSMADWIASNQEFFPLTPTGMHHGPDSRAAVALEQLGLTRPWRPSPYEAIDFRQRFGWGSKADLHPVQREAMRMASEATGPTLMCIESPTGSGKTEAAQLAGEILAERTGAGGMAFALPSMTTTDAMLPRMVTWIERLTDGSANHSIRLMHSKANLNQDFESLVRATRGVNQDDSAPSSEGDRVIAHAWFSGRKGVLSEFVVCTVDQILMVALATRYVTLRHLGLAGKVIVIDEVHSYDVYTSDYLARALTWLAAQGASVILLSATLAKDLRGRLVNAYRKGLRQTGRPGDPKLNPSARGRSLRRPVDVRASVVVPKDDSSDDVPYPRIVKVSHEGVQSVHVATPEECKHVHVSVMNDGIADLVERVARLTLGGGVVGIVCNTVRRAQEAAEALSARFPGLVNLLHSQFTAADRARKERALVHQLGALSSVAQGTRPTVRIVVGTSVIEQSIDVDFDVLISDLAPTDALAQRAGRLHRHQRQRPPELAHAQLILRGCDLESTPPTFDRGSTYIYSKRSLLATAVVIEKYLSGRRWCTCHELANDVELTYSADLVVPEHWRKDYEDARAQEQQEFEEARKRSHAFQLEEPAKASGRLSKALSAMTVVDVDRNDAVASAAVRDIDPVLEVALVQKVGDFYRPLPWLVSSADEEALVSPMSVPPARIGQVIADSVVRLPRRLVRPDQVADAIEELTTGVFQAWQRDFRLKDVVIVGLDECLFGEILGKKFEYHPEMGIVPL